MSMQAILAASQSMARMQTMKSAQTQMQGEVNVLRIESKQDGGNAKKDALASVLEDKSNNLMGDLMGEISDANEVLKPDEEIIAEETSKEEGSATKPPVTDTVELSDAAGKHIAEGNGEKPVVLEAVTYKADGQAKPSAPAKAAPKLDVTA